jgi:hypothetical protein
MTNVLRDRTDEQQRSVVVRRSTRVRESKPQSDPEEVGHCSSVRSRQMWSSNSKRTIFYLFFVFCVCLGVSEAQENN